MKERYNVEISDVHLTIVSDEPEEFVNATVEKISERVNDLIVHNKRCSKLDAALLCALDYCGEYAKAERRIRNLEAQISLYDANLKRMREELAAKGDAPESVKTALGISSAAPDRSASRDKSAEAPRHKTDDGTVSMLDGEGVTPTESATESSVESAPSAPSAGNAAQSAAPANAQRSKLEQIEMLLRKSNE